MIYGLDWTIFMIGMEYMAFELFGWEGVRVWICKNLFMGEGLLERVSSHS